jgi:hypothetical protein
MKKTIPADYVPRFSQADINYRSQLLSEECQLFIEDCRDKFGWDVNFDPLVIMAISQSALDDIWRYKVFHLRDAKKLSNGVKRAAYFVKWIVRFRPIYVLRPTSSSLFLGTFDKNDSTFFANESFAISFALNTLATEAMIPKIGLNPELWGNLLYDLHYRDMSGDALIQLFGVLERMAQGKPITAP